MRGDDLTTPLGVKRKRFLRLPLGLIGVAIITILVTTGLIWVQMVEDPLGGEPTATLELANSLDGVSQRDIGVNNSAEIPSGTFVLGNDGLPLSGAPQPAPAMRGPQVDRTNTASLRYVPGEPVPALLEAGPHGLLPRIHTDGTRALDVYSSQVPLETLSQARVAIVLGGIGLSTDMSAKALRELPANITLALSPYGQTPAVWAAQARQKGHEVLIQTPMEPFGFPENDAGPHSLMTRLPANENAERLSWIMAQASEYVGLINSMGERFTGDKEQMDFFLTQVRDRGLMYVDDGSSQLSKANLSAQELGVPFAKADLVVDLQLSQQDINAQLLQLESLARARGVAVGTATAFPITLRELARWSKGLEERGISLVPISNAIYRGQS